MAITTITPTKLFIGKQTKIVLATGVTLNSDDSLDTIFSSATGNNLKAVAKSITITPPEEAYDLVNFLGTDANGFQNQLLEEKPPTAATMTCTLILGEDETIDTFVGGNGTSITAGYTRYQVGAGNNQETDVLINISGSQGEVNVAFIDARLTKIGDIKIGGADGHWEQDVAITTLPKNFYWEHKD